MTKISLQKQVGLAHNLFALQFRHRDFAKFLLKNFKNYNTVLHHGLNDYIFLLFIVYMVNEIP